MRNRSSAFAFLVPALLAMWAFGSQGPSPSPSKPAEEADSRILPVVMLKPGETKELFMTVACRVGSTRGGGLWVRAMEDSSYPAEKGDSERHPKTLKRGGLTITVPDFSEAEKNAALPVYAPLAKKGLNAFIVKVTASKDAKPGLLNLHLADTTCSGGCATDFRVLVIEP
ncbi:MAG TPA: hypothetical protein VGZ25_04390 [Gemmataceae bacterium]|nr:hypothetical protein [Gemmataceae bacterium]